MKQLFFVLLIFAPFICFGQSHICTDKVVINDEVFSFSEYEIDTEIRKLGDLRVEIIQIHSLKGNLNDFSCKAIISTYKDEFRVSEIYYEKIEPVGSEHGVCFAPRNFEDVLIGSKYGDYSGELIVIDEKGKIWTKSGGDFFYDKQRNLIVSDWHSDLSGLTVFDLNKGQFVFCQEIDAFLSEWRVQNGEYYAASPVDNMENCPVYKLNLDELRLEVTDVTLEKYRNFKEVKYAGCKPDKEELTKL